MAVASARDRARLEEVAGEIRAAGARSWAGLADISDRQLCAFLASDAGGFITGQAIHVNGGAYLG